MAIAQHGQRAQVAIEQVGGHVLHRPLAGQGGALPVGGREAAQELQQQAFELGKERQGFDG